MVRTVAKLVGEPAVLPPPHTAAAAPATHPPAPCHRRRRHDPPLISWLNETRTALRSPTVRGNCILNCHFIKKKSHSIRSFFKIHWHFFFTFGVCFIYSAHISGCDVWRAVARARPGTEMARRRGAGRRPPLPLPTHKLILRLLHIIDLFLRQYIERHC